VLAGADQAERELLLPIRIYQICFHDTRPDVFGCLMQEPKNLLVAQRVSLATLTEEPFDKPFLPHGQQSERVSCLQLWTVSIEVPYRFPKLPCENWDDV
jgi:hypothetical protein